MSHVVADLHQAIVRVGVGNVAGATALNAGQAAPVVIGVGGHVPPGIGHARYQGAVGVVLVRRTENRPLSHAPCVDAGS